MYLLLLNCTLEKCQDGNLDAVYIFPAIERRAERGVPLWWVHGDSCY